MFLRTQSAKAPFAKRRSLFVRRLRCARQHAQTRSFPAARGMNLVGLTPAVSVGRARNPVSNCAKPLHRLACEAVQGLVKPHRSQSSRMNKDRARLTSGF